MLLVKNSEDRRLEKVEKQRTKLGQRGVEPALFVRVESPGWNMVDSAIIAFDLWFPLKIFVDRVQG
jgi:hypothetical protein